MKVVEIPAYSVIPLIEAMKEYFNVKYPCDTDESCGDDMPIEDKVKEACYNAMLGAYNEDPNYYQNEYDKLLNSAK